MKKKVPSNIFDSFKGFNKILVTGPQRSGTTICAKMIEYDLGLDYIDENRVGVSKKYSVDSLMRATNRFVLQCPGIAYMAHTFKDIEDLAVIFMVRSVSDIIKSQERIEWPYEKLELKKYGAEAGPIAEVKYRFWRRDQKPNMNNAFEINYKSLAAHKLWVEERKHFGPRQWM